MLACYKLDQFVIYRLLLVLKILVYNTERVDTLSPFWLLQVLRTNDYDCNQNITPNHSLVMRLFTSLMHSCSSFHVQGLFHIQIRLSERK